MAIRECTCGKCGDTRLTPAGTHCSCGGLYRVNQSQNDDMVRKAHGPEDTDLRKAGR